MRTPGGASSGSAAAVADAMVPLAIGTQTTASTIRIGPLMEQGIRCLARAGAQVKDIDLPPAFEQVEDAHRWLFSFEFARNFSYETLYHADKLSAALREGRIADSQRCTLGASPHRLKLRRTTAPCGASREHRRSRSTP